MSDRGSLLHHSRFKPRKRAFHGFSVGDSVCVHGEGFGHILEMGEAEYPFDDRVVVEVPRRSRHEASGQVIEWTERFTLHPMHVSRNLW